MEGSYMWNAGDIIAHMRLTIEGAIDLFEDEAMPLCRLGRENGKPEASTAFDTIGTALYDLRDLIRRLQEEHAKAVL